MKQVLVFFIYILISTASLFPNEFSLISYLDIANPKFTDNPASIALMSGINLNYDFTVLYTSNDVTRTQTYYDDLYDGIYEAQFENENTITINGKLALNNYGISFKKNVSKFVGPGRWILKRNHMSNVESYLLSIYSLFLFLV